jgi:uncharacterized repeat protein (TIGR01451 family)
MKKNYPVLPLLILLLFTLKLNSQVIQAFSPVISVTQKGDITFAANAITQCTGAGSACTNGRAEVPPAGLTHNQTSGITIGYIDNDGSTGIGAQTFSSSSSTLDMGGIGGCGVIYAYLTWGGFVTTGTSNYAKRDSVYFQVPGGGSYNKLKADLLVDNTAPYNRTYHCYKDVTAMVKAAGPGIYTTGNVVAATGGNNQFAGWTLVVLYSDASKSLKNLTIFRGLAGVSGTSSVQFGISGFFTPPAPAPVNVKLGFVAYDGDRAVPNAYNSGLAGDSLKFNGVAVSNGKNPQSDIFNSTITNDNAEYVRTPAYTNTLGYDADLITLANGSYAYLGNSASSATLRMSSGGETILTDIVTTAIDVFEPEMRFEKTVVNLNGNNPAQLGDLLQYTLKVYNKGSDPADSLIVIDSLYGALAYAPNTLQVLNGPNSGAKTDVAGDDQMEFVAAGNFIRARLGNNANATRGGTLNNIMPDSATTIRFNAYITNDCTVFHCFDSVYNMAYATYYGKTSLQQRSTFSSANGIDPATGCVLTGPTALKVVVPACALPADTSITGCVAYNLPNILSARPGYNAYYNSTWTQVTQATATGIYYAIKTIYPSNYFLTPCYDTIQINFTSTGSCALPITLSSFAGEIINDAVHLNWVTQTEINSKEFVVSRSADGINFIDIGQINAAGISNSSKAYSFTDNNANGMKSVFYRLTLIDKDGTKRYSNIIHLSPDGYTEGEMNIINIKPNPAVETAVVSVLSADNGKCLLQVFTANGQQVYKNNFSVVKNTVQQVTVNITSLNSGVYFLKITHLKTGITTNVSKLVVR